MKNKQTPTKKKHVVSNSEIDTQLSKKIENTKQIQNDNNNWKDCFKYWLEILVFIATIGGVIFGLITYKNDVKNRRQDVEDKRKEITIQYLIGFSDMLENTDAILLDTINFFNNKDLDTINYNKDWGEIKEDVLKKLLRDNKEWRRQLDNIMVYLNQLAIGCHEGFYDEHTAWYSNYYRIINAVSALQPYIDIRAKEEKYEEKYGKYSRPCGSLTGMTYRWNKKIGKCEEWEMNDSIESRKIKDEIEIWKAKQNK